MIDINFDKCKEHKTVVAFKPIDRNLWYTGIFNWLSKPSTKYNSDNYWKFSIEVILPINPQWTEDDDKLVYYYNEIQDIKILEL